MVTHPTYQSCHEVSPTCPVQATTYGYYPNLGGNVFYLLVFIFAALGQGVLGWRYRAIWKGYSLLVLLGCLGEALGYVGRLLLHQNPWNRHGFIMQILLLIVSPSFLAAALYMTLKALVVHFGAELARLAPRWWTWGFISADAAGFLTQCVGGGISAAAGSNQHTADIGTYVTVVGIAFQAVTMMVAALLAAEFGIKVSRNRGGRARVFAGEEKRLRYFLLAMAMAFFAILTRCIYRIPEMASGYGKGLMRNQDEFMIFDGAMIALAVILQTVVHPGIFAASAREPTRKAPGSEQVSDSNAYSFETLASRPGTA